MDKYNSLIAKAIGKLNGAKNGYAVTITKNTTLYSTPWSEVDKYWRLHEDCHKKQIATLGWWRFMILYFYELAKNGYTNNKYEIEARKAAEITT